MAKAAPDEAKRAAVREVSYHFSKGSYVRALLLHKMGLGAQALEQSPVVLRSSARRPLPGADWVRVSMALAGICGSDLGMLKATLSAQLSPFASFPAVLGHEGVGTIVEAGPGTAWRSGTRVVFDPFLGCAVRGLDPCPACAAGNPALCERAAEGRVAPGRLLGACRDLPGTWSEEVLLHESQLHAVPDALSNARAVLVEPLAVAAHAVLASPPRTDDTILVVGAGTIGLLIVAALRLLEFPNKVVVVARHPNQGRLAKDFGADVQHLEHAGLRALAEHLGARTLTALDGSTVLTSGADVVFDAVGTAEGLDLALRAVRPGGRVNVVGSPGRTHQLDVTGIWSKGVTVVGTMAYGAEPSAGGVHTFDLVLDRLVRRPDLPLERIITHRFPLTEVRSALRLLAGRTGTRPGKVLFEIGKGGGPHD